jgi:hypothetical protein
MNVNDLRGRVKRLDQLSRGLAKEELLVRKGKDPLLYRERQEYLKAIRQALSGVEGARVVLVKAKQSLEGGQGGLVDIPSEGSPTQPLCLW